MQFHLLNLYSALGIGVVIAAMARIPDIKSKALLYVLPIPISIGLVATHGVVTSSNLIGLLLIWIFFAITRMLVDTFHIHVIIADIVASLSYIALGYCLVRVINWPFWLTACIFLILWIVAILLMRRYPAHEKAPTPSALPASLKGGIASVVSFGIYSFKDRLAGIVVTFPYNGVFAVVEVRHHLEIFMRSVIRNTLAIAVLFVVMYFCYSFLSLPLNLLVGWAGFGITLWLVQKVRI